MPGAVSENWQEIKLLMRMPSTAQPSVFELIFCICGEEIEAVTFAVDPVIRGGRAAIFQPCGVSCFYVEDDFGEESVIAGEDGHAGDLIGLDHAIGGEAIHGFGEDGIRNRLQCKSLNLTSSDRAEEGWVGGWARRGGCIRRRGRCSGWKGLRFGGYGCGCRWYRCGSRRDSLGRVAASREKQNNRNG